MKYEINIEKSLYDVYQEIRLGCLRLHTDIKEPNDVFWSYMNSDVLPQIRSSIEGKEWGVIPDIRGSRSAFKAFGRNLGRYRASSESLLRRV